MRELLRALSMEPSVESAKQEKTRRSIGGIIIAALFFALKSLKVLVSGAKLLAIGKTVLSMALWLAVYAEGHGWAFAGTFLLLLFTHELGHLWAARRIGLPVSAPLFIPFIGAQITLKKNPQSVSHEAYMATGGPMLGSLAALAVLTAGCLMRSSFLVQMAGVGFFLNGFNLTPFSPLDGGRIVAAVSPWLWLIGAAVLFPMLILWHSWVLLLFAIAIGVPTLVKLFRERNAAWKSYHTCTTRQRIWAGVAWAGLLGLLGFLMWFCPHDPKNVPNFGQLLPVISLLWAIFLPFAFGTFFRWPLDPSSHVAVACSLEPQTDNAC